MPPENCTQEQPHPECPHPVWHKIRIDHHRIANPGNTSSGNLNILTALESNTAPMGTTILILVLLIIFWLSDRTKINGNSPSRQHTRGRIQSNIGNTVLIQRDKRNLLSDTFSPSFRLLRISSIDLRCFSFLRFNFLRASLFHHLDSGISCGNPNPSIATQRQDPSRLCSTTRLSGRPCTKIPYRTTPSHIFSKATSHKSVIPFRHKYSDKVIEMEPSSSLIRSTIKPSPTSVSRISYARGMNSPAISLNRFSSPRKKRNS